MAYSSKGAISYKELINSPFDEIFMIYDEINSLIEKEKRANGT